MSLFLKIMRSRESRATHQRLKQLQKEASMLNEDPNVYIVKEKLRNHPIMPRYKRMEDEQLTRRAVQLSSTESLKEFFSELIPKQTDSVMERMSTASQSPAATGSTQQQGQLERAGQLTLKLHLRHQNETPSWLVRLGANLLKIPYRVMPCLTGDQGQYQPNTSYIVEYDKSSLVQPLKKGMIENSALEATMAPDGARLTLPKTDATGNNDNRPVLLMTMNYFALDQSVWIAERGTQHCKNK